MNKIFKNILLFFIVVNLSVVFSECSVFAKDLPYRHLIVKEEIQKKGGNLKPLNRPKYKVLVTKYAISEQVNGFVESRIKETLHEILSKEKDKGIYDGITVFLYRSPKNAKTESTTPMAKVEWWPKGHSFSLDNQKNILNKSTHIEKYNVFSLPEKIKSTINGLSIIERKKIYKGVEVTGAESRKKAKTQHPKYSNQYYDKVDKLNEKAMLKILKKYNITSDIYNDIIFEGVNQHW